MTKSNVQARHECDVSSSPVIGYLNPILGSHWFKLIHFSDYNLSFGTVCNLTSSLFFFRICLLPDERSERKCTQQGDSFAELNPNFSENVVFQVSMLLSHFLSSHVSNNQAAVKKRESGKMLKTITLITFDWQ